MHATFVFLSTLKFYAAQLFVLPYLKNLLLYTPSDTPTFISETANSAKHLACLFFVRHCIKQ